MSYNHNKHILGNCGIQALKRIDSNKHIKLNIKWLSEKNENRFLKVKESSDLLAYDYSKLGQLLSKGKSVDLLNRILGSKESVSYQLQRIYINRNQIIHAGDFISEYTNLWMNMEWYVGKMLSFMIITELNEKSISDSFKEVESDYDYLVSYLDKNKKVLISDLPARIQNILYNQVWQSF